MNRPALFSFLVGIIALATFARAESIWLETLDLSKVDQEWGQAKANKSVDGHPITIAGRKFEHGLGTHAASAFAIDPKDATRISAWVGVDGEVKKGVGSVEFKIIGDGKTLFTSGVMKGGDEAKKVEVDLKGVKKLELIVIDTGDGINSDHADWADASFETAGAKPVASELPIPEQYGILTPKPGPSPRINGPRIFGARPSNPFLFTIPATGQLPIRFAAEGLPEGLVLDAETGRIAGVVKSAGTYKAKLTATNTDASDTKPFEIVIGDTICLTPPLGWNSWNCWAGAVDDEKVRAAADAMVRTGLINHGWTYINIDDTWQGERAGEKLALQPNKKFPDMLALADYIHGKGLKIGIYSTPWKKSYAGFAGGSADDEQGHRGPEGGYGKIPFHKQDASQYAQWQMDYLKYDWNPIDIEHTRAMSEALRASGRDIVFSLSNSANRDTAGELARLANCWRTTGDIQDKWSSVSGIGFSQDPWKGFAGPGHWNDPDMLVVGRVGWGRNLHATKLTPNEEYTHITLWSLLGAPMLLGCDLANLDEFTLSLLTNDEVLEVNQDQLGKQASRVIHDGDMEVWVREMADGSKAIGLFNRNGSAARTVGFSWKDVGVTRKQKIRDLWRQRDLGIFSDEFKVDVLAHGAVLLRIWPVSQ